MTTTPTDLPLLVIGGGTMGSALISAAVSHTSINPAATLVVEPDPARHAPFLSRGIRCETTLDLLARSAPASPTAAPPAPQHPVAGLRSDAYRVLLAVKPQVYPLVVPPLRSLPRPAAILSIMAGVRAQRIASDLLPHAPQCVLRAMPNTPARVSRGITALAFHPDVPHAHREFASRFFSAAGATIDIDEPLMDAFTALAGSGPAYVFYLAEAMLVAAAKLGFSPADADRIVRATILGSGVLLDASPGLSPSHLRAGVTSKGGTTAAACAVLDDAGVPDAVVRAVLAGARRAAELTPDP